MFAEPNSLFKGSASQRFQECLPRGGTRPVLIDNSRAAAFADYDNDGDVDILVVNNGQAARLLRNDAPSDRHWIRFRVLNRHGTDAIGARLCLRVGGATKWRLACRASSYLASQSPYVHFGLGVADRVADVRVFWPNGEETSFGPYDADQSVTLTQPE